MSAMVRLRTDNLGGDAREINARGKLYEVRLGVVDIPAEDVPPLLHGAGFSILTPTPRPPDLDAAMAVVVASIHAQPELLPEAVADLHAAARP